MEKTENSCKECSRREFIGKGGAIAIGIALLGQGYAMVRSLAPNVLYEPPKRVSVGMPAEFDQGYTFLDKLSLFVVREDNVFYTISSVCTHLGCNVKVKSLARPRTVELGGRRVTETMELVCPCHGSVFHSDGSVIEGPAPKDLARYPVTLSPKDGQLVVDRGAEAEPGFRLEVTA